MDLAEAERILEHLLSADCLRLSKHCRDQMAQREVAVDDIMVAMRNGRITNVRLNQDTGHHVVTLEGHDLDGMKLTMQAVLLEKDRRVPCVTLY